VFGLWRKCMNRNLLIIAIIMTFAASALAVGHSSEELARKAVSHEPKISSDAIAELRAMGPTGLDVLLREYELDVRRFSGSGEAGDDWKRIANAIDSVAMQKDAYASGLYWFTDMEAAKRAAKASMRPVLSLRLLGNLNEEFSCANSRLFRSLLYANTEVSNYLRENYVLHWRSVRPAPRITIDFGDGRKIERTITGNSIHYILDGDGMVIDALPGLYNPAAFLKGLYEGNSVRKLASGLADTEKTKWFMEYRKKNFDRTRRERERAIKTAKVKLVIADANADATALDAAPIALTKMLVTDEYSLLRVYDNFERFEARIDLSDWKKLANIYSPGASIDNASLAFVRRQNRNTGLSTAEFDGMISKLNEFIALDTTRNDFLYRLKIYELLNGRNGLELEALNDRVYDAIFKTPNSDKWLGLYTSDVYAAIDGNGIFR
jgi:hypothetical protein